MYTVLSGTTEVSKYKRVGASAAIYYIVYIFLILSESLVVVLPFLF